uniref:Uncharacterized protein n=1 Tax=Mola mola TaxID=94237 RepID=A0A3Q3X633_MOLML
MRAELALYLSFNVVCSSVLFSRLHVRLYCSLLNTHTNFQWDQDPNFSPKFIRVENTNLITNANGLRDKVPRKRRTVNHDGSPSVHRIYLKRASSF